SHPAKMQPVTPMEWCRSEARMLFLHRPRQTWMPYSLPRNRTDQYQYNRKLQDEFGATRRMPPPALATAPPPPQDPVAALKDLAQLHDAGALTDAEFTAAKAKLLNTGGSST